MREESSQSLPFRISFGALSSSWRVVIKFLRSFQVIDAFIASSACFNCTKGDRSRCLHPQCVTADGIERGLITVNRQLPGPAVQVCKDDLVVVDVANHMDGASASIHWHGIVQKETPFADGVPFLTQYPINSGNSFRYAFFARNSGTQMYHSHSGLQKADGIYGPFIVRVPDDSGFNDLYDHDNFTLLISDCEFFV
jgi:FtsP/CotA-like multicopper oxidase with cupredoxin domain